MSSALDLRTALRVTKYPPTLRDDEDMFMGDDWTRFSHVGSSFGGEMLTLSRYLEVEAQHLQVVARFLEEAGIETMWRVGAPTSPRERLQGWARRFRTRPWSSRDPGSLTCVEVIDLVREELRERDGWSSFAAQKDVYLHVGFDYYLYMGGNVPCERTVQAVSHAGLFADQAFISPWHQDP